jgi:hypothetical protein
MESGGSAAFARRRKVSLSGDVEAKYSGKNDFTRFSTVCTETTTTVFTYFFFEVVL